MKNLSKLEDYFDCSNLDENHELFSNVNKVIVKSKNATPKSLWIDKLCMLRAKSYPFPCSQDKENGVKRNKKAAREENKLEEYYDCLMGEGEYKKM